MDSYYFQDYSYANDSNESRIRTRLSEFSIRAVIHYTSTSIRSRIQFLFAFHLDQFCPFFHYSKASFLLPSVLVVFEVFLINDSILVFMPSEIVA